MSDSPGSAWWQLLRAGNVFTAVSNILAGYLLVRGEWQPLLPLIFLVLSSACLYLAGMVLNDVFDLEIDRVERPERPLPSGRIDLRWAKLVGWGLMIDGLTAAAVAAWLLASWLPIVMATLLATAIVAYDAALKNTHFGPLAMGTCRSLNVLLGASVVTHSSIKYAAYVYAVALGVYTLGLTLLARKEAGESTERELNVAGNLIQLGLFLMLLLATTNTLPKFGWYIVWIACLLSVRMLLYEAVIEPTPAKVQQAVSRLITMFIPLDALACAAAAGWPTALLVVSLLIPTYIATRRAPMT